MRRNPTRQKTLTKGTKMKKISTASKEDGEKAYKQWLASNVETWFAYPNEYRQERYRKECKLSKTQANKILKEMKATK